MERFLDQSIFDMHHVKSRIDLFVDDLALKNASSQIGPPMMTMIFNTQDYQSELKRFNSTEEAKGDGRMSIEEFRRELAILREKFDKQKKVQFDEVSNLLNNYITEARRYLDSLN